MTWVFCGSMLEEELVTFTYEEGDNYLFVEHVPSLVCNKCGERIYFPEVTGKLLKFAKNEFRPVKTLSVPVFNFAERP